MTKHASDSWLLMSHGRTKLLTGWEVIEVAWSDNPSSEYDSREQLSLSSRRAVCLPTGGDLYASLKEMKIIFQALEGSWTRIAKQFILGRLRLHIRNFISRWVELSLIQLVMYYQMNIEFWENVLVLRKSIWVIATSYYAKWTDSIFSF